MTRKTYCGNLLWQSCPTLLAPVGTGEIAWVALAGLMIIVK